MTATYEIQLPTVSQYVPYEHIYTSCQSSNTPMSSNMNLRGLPVSISAHSTDKTPITEIHNI